MKVEAETNGGKIEMYKNGEKEEEEEESNSSTVNIR